jgi:hypothetical protein
MKTFQTKIGNSQDNSRCKSETCRTFECVEEVVNTEAVKFEAKIQV